MAFKLAALLALAFVVAVSASSDYDWSDWTPPAQDGIYSEDQVEEITHRMSKCVNVIGYMTGSMEEPGQLCRQRATWKIREEPIQKEELIPFMAACLERYRDRWGIKGENIDKANACLQVEVTKPLTTQ